MLAFLFAYYVAGLVSFLLLHILPKRRCNIRLVSFSLCHSPRKPIDLGVFVVSCAQALYITLSI